MTAAASVPATAPSVSVIVPVHNGAATIGRCIESLLAQRYPSERLEIIIVDSASTDATAEIAGRYPVRLTAESTIRTSYAARNCGIVAARHDLIALIDADCVAERDWLARLVAPLEDPSVGAVVGRIDDARAETLCEEFTAKIRPFARPEQKTLRTLLTANVALRRRDLEALNLFDELLPTGGDVDLGWRLQQRLGLKITEATQAGVLHHHRRTLREVFRQYRRYGTSEILLATLYRGGAGSLPASEQLPAMIRQLRAVASYITAFIYRIARGLVRGFDRRDLFWPIFLFVVETGSLTGKLQALWTTRFFRRTPYLNRRIERTR